MSDSIFLSMGKFDNLPSTGFRDTLTGAKRCFEEISPKKDLVSFNERYFDQVLTMGKLGSKPSTSAIEMSIELLDLKSRKLENTRAGRKAGSKGGEKQGELRKKKETGRTPITTHEPPIVTSTSPTPPHIAPSTARITRSIARAAATSTLNRTISPADIIYIDKSTIDWNWKCKCNKYAY